MIRPLQFGDYPSVLRLISQEVQQGLLLPRDKTYLRRHETEFVVAAENSHVGGAISFHRYSPRLGEALAFAVSPAFRKKGYDTLLMKECQRLARQNGTELVMIVASAAETAFLKKLGFGPATAKERFGLFWNAASHAAGTCDVPPPPPPPSGYDRRFVRPATIKEVEPIFRLIDRAAQKDELLPRARAEIEKHLEEFFVATGGGPEGPVVGCAALEVYQPELSQQKPELAEVRSLVVDPCWVNQNYGKHLVLALQEQARARGVGEVLAVTSQMKFFRELGFKRATRQDCLAFFWHP